MFTWVEERDNNDVEEEEEKDKQGSTCDRDTLPVAEDDFNFFLHYAQEIKRMKKKSRHVLSTAQN